MQIICVRKEGSLPMAAVLRKKPLPHAYSAVQISSWRGFIKILKVVRGSKRLLEWSYILGRNLN